MFKAIKTKFGTIYIFIDDEDEAKFDAHHWSVTKQAQIISVIDGQTTTLPRYLLGYDGELIVYHIDGNLLNNRKSNLRLVTQQKNIRNRRKHRSYKSKPALSIYKGVTYDFVNLKWKAQITVNKKYVFLGLFVTELEAAIAYNDASLKYFGEFAKKNSFPPNEY